MPAISCAEVVDFVRTIRCLRGFVLATTTSFAVGLALEIHSADAPFRRGDANADGVVDLGDGVRILGALFLGEGDVTCEDALDADDSGVLDLSDAIYLLRHLFAGTPAPPTPGIRECGFDFVGRDELSCEEYLPPDSSLACSARLPEVLLPLPTFFSGPRVFGEFTPSSPLVVSDFNADGLKDVVSNLGSKLEIRFALDGGRLSFPQTVDSALSSPASTSCVDIDGVHGEDFVRYDNQTFRVLVNEPGGTFRVTENRQVFSVTSGLRLQGGVEIDVDVDGVFDLFFLGAAVQGRATERLVTARGMGGGRFERPIYQSIPSTGRSVSERGIVSADFDVDGFPDIAFIDRRTRNLTLLVNQGDLTFYVLDLPTNLRLQTIATSDVDSDGVADIVGASSTGKVAVLYGDGRGLFVEQLFFDDPAIGFRELHMIDSDGGGKTAVVAASDEALVFEVQRGGLALTGSLPAVHGAIAFNDLDSDDRIDVLTDAFAGTSVFLGADADGWRVDRYGPSAGVRSIHVVDFDGDRADDLIMTTFAELHSFRNQGNGQFVPASSQSIPGNHLAVLADLDADRSPDVLVAHAAGVIVLLASNTPGFFEEFPAVDVGGAVRAMVPADLDGDGVVDLAMIVENRLRILMGRGDGTFDRLIADDPRGVTAIAAREASGNRKAELFVASPTRMLRIFRGDGARLALAEEFRLARRATAIDLGDMNGDGISDLILDTGPWLEVRLGDAEGSFSSHEPEVFHFGEFLDWIPPARGRQVVDLDRDGKMDLCLFLPTHTAVLRGQGDGRFGQPEFFGCCGEHVLFGDLDGNGRLDVVSRRFGRTTVYLDQRQ